MADIETNKSYFELTPELTPVERIDDSTASVDKLYSSSKIESLVATPPINDSIQSATTLYSSDKIESLVSTDTSAIHSSDYTLLDADTDSILTIDSSLSQVTITLGPTSVERDILVLSISDEFPSLVVINGDTLRLMSGDSISIGSNASEWSVISNHDLIKSHEFISVISPTTGLRNELNIGQCVDIHNGVIVSSTGDTASTENERGDRVYVFRPGVSPGTYTEHVIISPTLQARFGYSVTVFNDYIFIGSPLENGTGEVHVYRWDGTIYIFVHTLTKSNSYINGVDFGSNVKADKVTGSLLVSVPDAVETAFGGRSSQLGHTLVYQNSGGVYSLTHGPLFPLTGDSDAAGESRGNIDIHDMHFIVGDTFSDEYGSSSGRAVVYRYNAGTYTSYDLIDPTINSSDVFGKSVSIYKDYAIVTSQGSSNNFDGLITSRTSGMIHLFKWNGSSYDLLPWSDVMLNRFDDNNYGEHAVWRGEYIYVGDSRGGSGTSMNIDGNIMAYKFDFSSDKVIGKHYMEPIVTREFSINTGITLPTSSYFGRCFAVDGDILAAGAPGAGNASNIDIGAVFVVSTKKTVARYVDGYPTYNGRSNLVTSSGVYHAITQLREYILQKHSPFFVSDSSVDISLIGLSSRKVTLGNSSTGDHRLTVNGTLGLKHRSVTSSFQMIDDEDEAIVYNVSTGPNDITVTLPNLANTDKQVVFISKVDASNGRIFLDGGTGSIDDGNDVYINRINDSLTLVNIGTQWKIVGSYTNNIHQAIDFSSDYAIQHMDIENIYKMTVGSSDVTVTLPAAILSKNRVITIKKMNTSAFNLNLISGNLIDGSAAQIVSSTMTVHCDGLEWIII